MYLLFPIHFPILIPLGGTWGTVSPPLVWLGIQRHSNLSPAGGAWLSSLKGKKYMVLKRRWRETCCNAYAPRQIIFGMSWNAWKGKRERHPPPPSCRGGGDCFYRSKTELAGCFILTKMFSTCLFMFYRFKFFKLLPSFYKTLER